MAKLVTKASNPVRLSYVFIEKPREDSGKYSVCIMIPKKDKELKKLFDQAIEKTAEEDAAKWGGKIPSNLSKPIHDGDADKADEHPEFEGMWYLNASSNRRPGVLDENKDDMLDLSELYSGCWARVSLNFAGYNQNGNRGIGAYINNIMKLKDDTRLGGSSASAESDFGDDDDDDML